MNKPNFVFILIDDMGWKDLSCYGSDFYETPNIDRLAQEGTRFTDAYASCPVCSPTRASILTGKYPAAVGITDWIDWHGSCHPRKGRLVDVPYLKSLPLEEKTIAATLRKSGYQTWHVGKWHLGGPDTYPEKHGFDVNVGGCEWGCPIKGYFSPWDIPVLEDGPEGEYLTDHLTDKAVRLIRDADDRPFFLNLWYYSVHTPIQAKEEKIEKYRAKAQAMGLDKVEAFSDGGPVPYENPGNRHISRRVVQSDPVYAAMIESLDENIGRILDALAETGQADNTIVVFTSDNGGLATTESSPTCNAPLAEGKGWMYEGGTREPLLVKWPGVTAPGSVCSSAMTSPDFYPTILDMAGLPLEPDQHTDGVSIVPMLRGDESFERGPMFWHYPHYGNQGGTPGASVRVGDFKLIEFFEDRRVELYNVRDDISEERDLAAADPEKVEELRAMLRVWQEAIQAKFPAENPDWPGACRCP